MFPPKKVYYYKNYTYIIFQFKIKKCVAVTCDESTVML